MDPLASNGPTYNYKCLSLDIMLKVLCNFKFPLFSKVEIIRSKRWPEGVADVAKIRRKLGKFCADSLQLFLRIHCNIVVGIITTQKGKVFSYQRFPSIANGYTRRETLIIATKKKTIGRRVHFINYSTSFSSYYSRRN